MAAFDIIDINDCHPMHQFYTV
ncbi:hypothetical protein CCACVL1_11928 [Corchorus capsularis]|uniref:Uncharacterized protein n=1 Tax=Corchorus capsularis TaxID=210143 RepID=A0A1R3IIZ0_COCAP|nr:hypothetical protein CCACVL1_11928 [Corchorus capsularis]